MLSWLHRIGDELYFMSLEFFQGITDFFEWLFQLDFSMRLMDDSFGFFHGVSDVFEWFFQIIDGTLDRPLWQTILLLPVLIPYWIGSTIYAMLAFPITLAYLEPDRWRNLGLGVPSLMAMSLTSIVFLHASTNSKSIDDRYRNAMIRAMATGDFNLAKILGGRLVSDHRRVDPETRFSYAIALQKTGEMQRFQAVLANLAPNDTPGFGPAHRLRAMSFAEQLKQGSNKSILEQLRWHLDNSGVELNADTERLWTAYFVTVGQLEQAIPHLQAAADIDPRNLISLANLYAQTKNSSGENRALRAAEHYFERRLIGDPLSHDDRIQLAISQARLGKPDLAEKTVLRGVVLLNDAQMRRSAADFYVLRYDFSRNETPADVVAQFGYLEKALKHDCNYGEIYERLIQLYESSRSTDEGLKVLELLKSMLAAGNSVALTHFALSGIYQALGDQSKAQFHLDQSYSLDPNFPLVTNNLAWMMAHSDPPDLESAHALAEKALAAKPNDPRFRDTMATILMKQGKTQQAIVEFEAILATAPNKTDIHRKLVELYEKLDRHDIAQIHSEKVIAGQNLKKGR